MTSSDNHCTRSRALRGIFLIEFVTLVTVKGSRMKYTRVPVTVTTFAATDGQTRAANKARRNLRYFPTHAHTDTH